ncbi:hypothetical protein F5Y16DRAFT_377925 [Xylariaceae sp. FL0255]|nr:hypothetical protein F5Y16DRAFT_377925 [Xylariaceae sp. FL0255]
MTLSTGARLVRLQPTLLQHHRHHHHTSILLAASLQYSSHTSQNRHSPYPRQTRPFSQTCPQNRTAPNPKTLNKRQARAERAEGITPQTQSTDGLSPLEEEAMGFNDGKGPFQKIRFKAMERRQRHIPQKENFLDFRDPMNPPEQVRAPALELPDLEPNQSNLVYFFRLGKAYMKFYKTAVKQIWTSRELLKERAYSPEWHERMTRAAFHVRERVPAERRRLIPFALLLLICGEFTPFIVLAFPRITPVTCRIPAQREKIQKSAAKRRKYALELHLKNQDELNNPKTTAMRREGLQDGHICRMLNIGSSLWDRLNLAPPLSQVRIWHTLSRLATDDRLIREGGGVHKMVDEEVVLACEDRGLNVIGRTADELRYELDSWLIWNEPPGPDGWAVMDHDAEYIIRHHFLCLRPAVEADTQGVREKEKEDESKEGSGHGEGVKEVARVEEEGTSKNTQ